MISLRDRVAIVTGAGGGLGRAYARALSERGAKVLVNDLGADLQGRGHDAARADLVAAEIVAAGGKALADHHSVATVDGGREIVRHALESFGRVDILVNNAGNMRLSSFIKLDLDHIAELLDVHLGGAFYVTQPAFAAMAAQQRGRIIFTVSGIGSFGIYGAGLYAAAKGGIIGLMNALKLEAVRYGIRVNAVAPMAHTRMSGDELYGELPAQSVSPELVAPVVVYLASDECEPNGEIWSAGAGSVARVFTARAEGYFKHPETEGPLSAEDLLSSASVVSDSTRFTELKSWPDEWKLVVQRYRASAPGRAGR
jgi:NAD(P)-dependent dehydrogenase (short-subunit alcohol dehydrogenase family)